MTHGWDEDPATSFSLDAPCFGRAKSTNRAGALLSLPKPDLIHTAQQEAFESGLSGTTSLSPRSLGGWSGHLLSWCPLGQAWDWDT